MYGLRPQNVLLLLFHELWSDFRPFVRFLATWRQSLYFPFTQSVWKSKNPIIFIALWFGNNDNNRKFPTLIEYNAREIFGRLKADHIKKANSSCETKLIEFHFIISIIQMECNQSYLCEESKLKIIEPNWWYDTINVSKCNRQITIGRGKQSYAHT